jgi:hypothetical protein
MFGVSKLVEWNCGMEAPVGRVLRNQCLVVLSRRRDPVLSYTPTSSLTTLVISKS